MELAVNPVPLIANRALAPLLCQTRLCCCGHPALCPWGGNLQPQFPVHSLKLFSEAIAKHSKASSMILLVLILFPQQWVKGPFPP